MLTKDKEKEEGKIKGRQSVIVCWLRLIVSPEFIRNCKKEWVLLIVGSFIGAAYFRSKIIDFLY